MNKNKSILIVDDSKTTAKVFELKLKAAGFQVQVAYNGQEALDILENAEFDLIVLDLIMPVLDGFEVLKKLKEIDSKAEVIITSSLSQIEDLKRAKDLGASNFFMKSNTTIATIVEYVEKILYA